MAANIFFHVMLKHPIKHWRVSSQYNLVTRVISPSSLVVSIASILLSNVRLWGIQFWDTCWIAKYDVLPEAGLVHMYTPKLSPCIGNITDNIIEQANVRDHFYQYPLSDSLSYLMKRNPKHHPASQLATPLLVLKKSLHFHSIQWR